MKMMMSATGGAVNTAEKMMGSITSNHKQTEYKSVRGTQARHTHPN